MTKTVAVLGSTGSIGRQTLQVVQELGLTVAALTANRQVDLLEQQARQLHPKLAVLYDRAAAGELRLRLSDTDIRVAEGPEGLLEAATLPEADTVVTAVMGSVGLEPTLAAIREKKRIALANKETLVWRRRAGDGGGGALRRRDRAGGFGALGHFPEPAGLPGSPGGKASAADLLRRAVFRPEP